MLLGRHPPIDASLYDDSASDDLSYYSEVSIHFLGGGAPLLLSISEAAFDQLHQDLQGNSTFVTVESLANQTAVIRVAAVADLYFSSEAFGDYGPEHDSYTDHLSIQIPDARDWEIIESLAADEIGLEDFDPTDVQRIREMVMVTDEQYAKLVADGLIKAEDLESERAKNQRKTDQILELSSEIKYQLSTGKQRRAYVDDNRYLFDSLYELTDFDGEAFTESMIRLELEGRHRIAFISKDAVDYIMVPTHRYNDGRVEASAADLDNG